MRAESKLFVGGLAWHTNAETLKEGFAIYGTVLDAFVIEDRDTGRSRGFGFVTMSTQKGAIKAIQGLDNTEFDGRIIRVTFANQRRS